MTVETEACYAELAWTGVETVFSPGFKAMLAAHVQLRFRDGDDIVTTLTAGFHAAVTLGVGNAVTVTPLDDMPAAPGTMLIERVTPALQDVAFADLGSYSADVHERLHDMAAMRAAENRRAIAAVEAYGPSAEAARDAAEIFSDQAEAAAALALEYVLSHQGTSTSNLAIGLGSKVFVTQAGKLWQLGQRLRAASDDGAKAMVGVVTAYAGTSLTLEVDQVIGSGSHADWNIAITGERGAAGPTGGGDLLAENNLDDVADPATALANLTAGLAGNGLVARTSSSAVAARSIAAGTGISVTSGDGVAGNPTVAVDKASNADVAAAASNKVLTADLLSSASAMVALVDAATVAVDWTAAAAGFSLTITANRVLGNPTNGIPGQYRTILVQANTSTDRALTFGNQYLGEVPTLSDIDDTRWYELTIKCITTSHFIVSAKKAKGT